MKNQSVTNNLDWISVFIYIVLVIMGWLNIYSSSLSLSDADFTLDLSQFYGKQLLSIGLAIPLIFIVLSVDSKFYEKFSSIIYIIGLLSLLGSLALAKYLSDVQVNLKDFNKQLQALGIIFIPVLLIVIHDPGSALIFMALFFVLYREGLPPWYLWTGFIAIILFVLALVLEPWAVLLIAACVTFLLYYRSRFVDRNIIASLVAMVLISGFVFSVDYVFDSVFKQHHRDRFNILLGKEVDMKGIGYNTNQSEIAIGSGGWFGKGYLEGTQTKGGFVPEQHTDYIFTTVGEEWGFLGSLLVIALFIGLIFRIIYLAERQKTKFSRVYGYCVACILFIHFFVNIAMVAGIFPTIGVPLPFFSYGGSGLWGFTILLFIFLKMDANKVNEW